MTRARRYRWSRFWPLWLRAGIVLASAVVLASFAAGEVTRGLVRDDTAMGLKLRSDQAFSAFSGPVLEALTMGDGSPMNETISESVRLVPELHSIHLADREGFSLVSWRRQDVSGVDDPLSFYYDVHQGDQRVGSLSLGWHVPGLGELVERYVSRTRALTFGVATLLALLVVGTLQWLALGPMERVRRYLLAMAEGRLGSRLPVTGGLELSLLTSSANRLRRALRREQAHTAALEEGRKTLSEDKEQVDVTLRSMGDGVISTDIQGHIQYLNPAAEGLTGWKCGEACGLPLMQAFFLVDEVSRRRARSPITVCLEQGSVVSHTAHTLLISRSGKENAIEYSAAPIRGSDGQTIGAVVIFHDNTPARRLARQIEYQASHDPLTKLTNRREFERRLGIHLEESRQDQAEHSLLYLDLDQFKVVNDTCGHAAGDALLQQLSPLIKSQLRKDDVFGRLGGDEFGILLRGCPLEQGIRIADVVRATVSGFRFLWQDKSFRLGVSIGVVSINAESGSAETVLQAADEACYAAKENGRNRIHVYKADDRELAARRGEMQWVSEIHAALSEDRLLLYGQDIAPVAETNTQGAHYEVLLRMRDRQGGLTPPGAFLPAAERYGLMPTVDRWVIRSVFGWLQRHPRHLKELCLCAVNLSATSASDEKFLDFVVEQFQNTGVPPHKICFEITETAVVANLARARSFIATLKDMGCVFALDDFGSGMSSFAYLRDLPVDILKIDGSFIKDIATDEISAAMVKSINEIGHVMEKKTIAEFVEDLVTLEKLHTIGVDYAQGFGIARPVPLERLVADAGLEEDEASESLASSA